MVPGANEALLVRHVEHAAEQQRGQSDRQEQRQHRAQPQRLRAAARSSGTK